MLTLLQGFQVGADIYVGIEMGAIHCALMISKFAKFFKH